MPRMLLALIAVLVAPVHAADNAAPLGLGLEEISYPYPVHFLPLEADGEKLAMAYMDIAPSGKRNGRTAVLLHGRNFFGEYWKDTIAFLAKAGWRVIVPDQIGFGKSSKPDIALSFHWLAHNTRQLLDTLGVDKVDLIAHSMGCMLAVRFTLMYPNRVDRLVLEGPIGLEDYRLQVPYATRDQLIASARAQTRQGVDSFFRRYFVNWQDRYQFYADVAWRWTLGPEAERLHRIAATTYAMAYEQPTLYEMPRIKQRTLIVVGDHDRSAIGRDRAPPQVRESLGLLPELASRACKQMADCSAVVLNDTGHIPHLEATENFHLVLYSFLGLTASSVFDSRYSPAEERTIQRPKSIEWHVDCVISPHARRPAMRTQSRKTVSFPVRSTAAAAAA